MRQRSLSSKRNFPKGIHSMPLNYSNQGSITTDCTLRLKIMWSVFSQVDPAVTVVQCLDRQISKILYILIRGDI